MSLFALKMTYEKNLSDYLSQRISDPSSQLNQSVLNLGGQILSFYSTQSQQHLIFIFEAPIEYAKQIEQSIIKTAPSHYEETLTLGWPTLSIQPAIKQPKRSAAMNIEQVNW